MRSPASLALVAVLIASCKGCDDEPRTGDAGPKGAAVEASVPPASADAALSATRPADSGPPADASIPADAALPTDAGIGMGDEPFGDAGTSTCRLVYGPAEQPFRGPAALSVAGQELRLVVNDAGKPHIYSVAIPPRGAAPVVPPRPTSFVGVRWPPCELAGRFVYCQAPGGAIVRSTLGSTEAGGNVAKSRAGTRIAAAPLGSDHSIVAYLDSRHTSEGDMLQAFAVLDDQSPVRLSEEGAGATTVRFVSRGEAATAVYLDTRTSMVPVHARPASFKASELALGTDVVVYVGGAPERGIDFDVAMAGSHALAFVPMPHDVAGFGMATLPIDELPKDAVAAVWSDYPNGLDPAPIAAAPARDGKTAWVARIRPREKAVGSPRILELGRVDANGAFNSYGEIAPSSKNKLTVTDISIADDGNGVWVLYGDSTSSWLERRICP